VRGRVLAHLALVVRRGDDLAAVDDDRPDRHVVVLDRALGLAEGEPHEVLITREEALGHPSIVPVPLTTPVLRVQLPAADAVPRTPPRRP
jgi:hypothetical protein